MISKKQINNEHDCQLLIGFLLQNPNQTFRAAELKMHSDVPKGRVRKLVTGREEVKIIEQGGRYFYQAAK